MPTVKPTPVSANTQLLTWMNKFNDLLSYSSLWDGGQLAKLTDDSGLVFPLASGGNLNTLKGASTKNYVPANAVNSPVAVAGVVDVDAVDANNATQVFTTLGTGVVRKFSRNLVSGTWTAWTEYASTSLASTTNAGLMSPTDKTNLGNAQLFKLVTDSGANKVATSSDITTFFLSSHAGRYLVGSSTKGLPNRLTDSEKAGILDVVVRMDNSVQQLFTSYTGRSFHRYVTNTGGYKLANSDVDGWIEYLQTPQFISTLLGTKFTDTTVANFVAKVSGSTTVNPHTIKAVAGSSLAAPTSFGGDVAQDRYNATSILDASTWSTSNSTNNSSIQVLFSFNLIEHIQRQYGITLLGTTTDKVAWLKSNLSRLTFNWHGYGSSATGNKANLSRWEPVASNWVSVMSHATGSVARLQAVPNMGMIDASGVAHFLAYTEPSDGVTPAIINTDYAELLVELKTDILSNLPLATTTTAGAMSPTDKAGLDGAQKFKLTQDDGQLKNATGASLISDLTTVGEYMIGTSYNDHPQPGYIGKLIVSKLGVNTTQELTILNTSGLVIAKYLRNSMSGMFSVWKKLADTNLIGSTLLGNKFVDQSTANFVGKVSGSTTANPHTMRTATQSTFLNIPSAFSYENIQSDIDKVASLDGTSYKSTSANANAIPQQLYSFDLISHVQRTYGIIPGATTADKVVWLKSNLSKLTFNWFGFGSSPTGNKANIEVWTGSNWTTNWNTNTASSPSKLSNSVSGVAMQSNYIGSDGFIHFLAFAQASDGTTASVINTDYVELIVELSTDLWNSAKPQWVNATLQNGWMEFDATQTPKFTLGKDGFVDMVGAIKGGSLGSIVAVLPVGYRPLKTTRFPLVSGIGSNNFYTATVTTSGQLLIIQGVGTSENGYIHLDGIRFPTT